jgi:integrase
VRFGQLGRLLVTHLKLKHVDRFVDRHGHVRHYFRRNRGPRILLPGEPGSSEFMRAYEAALAGDDVPASPKRRQRGEPGTFDDLLQLFFESANYAQLSAVTRRVYRLQMEKLFADEGIGGRLVSQMKREHASRMIAKRASTPAAANNALKVLRILVRFAIDNGWRDDDPTMRIKRFTLGEHHSWTDEEISAFEARWPIGTSERTAFALLLYTGQRVSDVAKMSWRDLDGHGLNIVQVKTKEKLWIPLHPDLTAILAQWPRTHIAIITSTFGKPFPAAGFGQWMAKKIAKAGLPDRCVTHGLRKAAARRLADAGCTPHQIMSITGHRSLKEVERYTKAAEQRRLAQVAIERLQGQATNKDSQPRD